MRTTIYSLVSLILSYHSFAFVMLQYDFREWSHETRLLFLFVNFIWWIISLFLAQIDNNY